ncbi:MAG: helix-turn-helix domain-containing protein [Clostridiales Family XIII bacterium]|nr:helix-turn-helix domain-containing protein [Clostridiales Family XIII bacterium]
MGKRLKSLRTNLGMSQTRLAEELSIKQSTIVRYEDGTTTPSSERLVQLADVFDVSLDYIYGRADDPQGILYSYEPEVVREKFADQENMREFVEFCFTPGTAGNAKLKAMLTDMLVADQPRPEKKKSARTATAKNAAQKEPKDLVIKGDKADDKSAKKKPVTAKKSAIVG